MSDETRCTSLRNGTWSNDQHREDTASLHHVTQSETAGLFELEPTTRQRAPSKILNSDEVRIEKAIKLKARRAVLQSMNDYELAFHKFVSAHVANDSYEREKEGKFLIDVELSN